MSALQREEAGWNRDDDRFGRRRREYVESLTSAVALKPEGTTLESGDRAVWLLVDGTRDGLIRTRGQDVPLPGCRDGKQTQSKGGGQSETVECSPLPVYVADLPTDAKAMLDYLYHHSSGGNPRDQQAFTTAADLIREAYLSPAALAAVFDAVARIQGVDVTGEVSDLAGRHGVAVALTQVQGMRTELIFDKGSRRATSSPPRPC
ncbi:CU044_5270 family protein [Dactylosporangium sp. CA-233914]|uniref:CU044_5270 family protein n=1 Tax=Dactylosporangium sp. CA-233914 TaxID=3239934 RepID=UPI003D927448